MEHSAATDASKATGAAAQSSSKEQPTKSRDVEQKGDHAESSNGKHSNESRRKRKGDFYDSSMRHGSRNGRDNSKRHKKGDLGRGEYFASNPDRRQRNDEANQKRQRDGESGHGVQFSKDEIDAEERRPKRKVAVLIGYSGTGYKGMQISGTEKTIEGDLFTAFVKAGAISKANAEDPKKSSLVRCARTDKGVHAAGNMISLKLIVEEDDIVEKINAELSPQIRVWGIERTIGSFSCYQACDSRWYEYLIPSHAFLPPHHSSWLAKQLEAAADECADREGYERRQAEVKNFWERVDEEDIKPILESIDEDIRWDVVKALQGEDEAHAKATKTEADPEQPIKVGKKIATQEAESKIPEEATVRARLVEKDAPGKRVDEDTGSGALTDPGIAFTDIRLEAEVGVNEEAHDGNKVQEEPGDLDLDRIVRLRAATKRLRNAYVAAKRRYRIPIDRVDRVQDALNKYLGTRNYHNYTIQKTFKDPSSKRHIKSFVVDRKPILIGDGPDEMKTEWLSLKIHGQSFMMHQIRKMVGMVTLMVRSGSKLETMDDSFTASRYSIPKVPGLGLLLERPVFDSYNTQQAPKHGREALKFSKYETALEAFKEKEIYQRIFREEEEKNEFGRFFNHVDNFKEPYFLYVTSKGLDATKGVERKGDVKYESDGE